MPAPSGADAEKVGAVYPADAIRIGCISGTVKLPEHEAADRIASYAEILLHHRLNRPLAQDRRGRRLESVDDACAHAVHRTPSILGKTLRSTTNTSLSTEVSDRKYILVWSEGQ